MSYNNSGARQDRPNSGVLFTNDRKQADKQPDMTGYLLFDTDVMEALIKSHRAGLPMKLQISGWMGRSNRGTDYVSMRFGVRDTEIAQQEARGQRQGSQTMQQPVAFQRPVVQQPMPARAAPQQMRSMSDLTPARQAPQQQPQAPLLDDEIPF